MATDAVCDLRVLRIVVVSLAWTVAANTRLATVTSDAIIFFMVDLLSVSPPYARIISFPRFRRNRKLAKNQTCHQDSNSMFIHMFR